MFKFLLPLFYLHSICCFLPQILETDLSIINKIVNLDRVSESLSHEEILRRGLMQSVAKYIYEKSNSIMKNNTNFTKLENGEYYNLNNFFKDYYETVVDIDVLKFDLLLKTEFYSNVAIVDFDPRTRNLPYAHCDGETLLETNERIIKFNEKICAHLAMKEYSKARKLISQILHTIHDFYSHSNWIEMGMNEINKNIGLPYLNNQSVIRKTEKNACDNNCRLIIVKCDFNLDVFISFLKKLGLDSSIIDCPLKYYICQDNILIKDKLLSGYASGQKLEDGSPYEKPDGLMKCSHGGIMDIGSHKDAKGGINKDSGFYMFSPHAHLHLKAANLAIKHTAYFFDQLRIKIGDEEYAKFLGLDNKPNKYIVFFKNLISFVSSSSYSLNYFNSKWLILLSCLSNYVILKIFNLNY